MVENKKIELVVDKIGKDITNILKACLEYQEDGYVKGLAEGYRKGYDRALADVKKRVVSLRNEETKAKSE